MTLPIDYTRCHGKGCAVRKECARHASRPAENTVLSWASTLNPDGGEADCLHFIPLRREP
jgi:hypothetical protein